MADLINPENGDVWINSDTNNLKYKVDEQVYSQVPQIWYTAGEAITKGRFVSMGNGETWTIGLTIGGKVYHTDSQYTDKVLGLALNDADADALVEVQRDGRYVFNPSAPLFEDSSTFADHIGETVYIRDSPDGALTTDRDTAALDGNNLLSAGIVLSATELIVKIEGDSRGPLGYSENQYTLGENITVGPTPVLMCQKLDGKAYRASKQKSTQRNKVIGFVINTGDLVANDKIVVRRLGLVTGFSGLAPGVTVYADGDDTNFGGVTQLTSSVNPYLDSSVNLGIALTATELITCIEPNQDAATDSNPVGSITLIDTTAVPPVTTPDSGCLLMDGASYLIADYPDLYAVIGRLFGPGDATHFDLGNLNTGALKYQITYKNFFQLQTLNPPIYKIEYPSNTTWETYDNADIDVEVTSFGTITEEQMKDIFVKVYAKKSGTVCLPDFFQYSGTSYGYSFEWVDNTHIKINMSPGGLAYMNTSGVLVVLDNTWEIKVIVYKDERLNRYRDSDADYKLNTMWDSDLSTDNLYGYWSFDSVAEFPDKLGTTSYFQDNFFSTDSFISDGYSTVSFSNGSLVAVSNTVSSFGIKRTLNFSQKKVRLKIRNVVGSRTAFTFGYLIGGSTYSTSFTLENTKDTQLIDLTLATAGTATEFSITCTTGGSINDSFILEAIYIGDASYESYILDDSGRGNLLSITGAAPVTGISGKALRLSSSTHILETINNLPNDLQNRTLSTWFKSSTKPTGTLGGLFDRIGSGLGSILFGVVTTAGYWNPNINLDGVSGISTPIPVDICDGQWHHLCAIYDRADKATYLLDGGVSGYTTISAYPTVIWQSTKRYWQYEVSADYKWTTGSVYIDEPLMFTRALSIGEAQILSQKKGLAKSGNYFSAYKVVSTTDSTDIYSGSFVTAGGIGVAKKAYIGTDLNVGNNVTISGTILSATALTSLDLGTSIVTKTINIGTGGTTTQNKTINIGTGGLAGTGVTAITIGTDAGTTPSVSLKGTAINLGTTGGTLTFNGITFNANSATTISATALTTISLGTGSKTITTNSSVKTGSYVGLTFTDTSTTSTNSLNKTAVAISSTGLWTSTNSSNIALYLTSSGASGSGSANYALYASAGDMYITGNTTLNGTLTVNGTSMLATAAQTINLGTSAGTKSIAIGTTSNNGAISIGTGATAGTTSINIGTASYTSTTVNGPMYSTTMLYGSTISTGRLNLRGNSTDTTTGGVTISDTTISNDSTNGALIVSGGVGIAGALNVGGNSILTGTLSVGTTGSTITMGTTAGAGIATLTTNLTTTGNLFNTSVASVNIGGAATAIGIGASTATLTFAGITLSATAAQTINLGTSAGTKSIAIGTTSNNGAISIGTGATAGTTSINIGTASYTSTTVNGPFALSANSNFTMTSGTGTHTQTYTGTTTNAATITANSLTTATALTLTANALTTGKALSISSTSTARTAATNSLVSISSSGTNAVASAVVEGINVSVTNAGTTNTNIALKAVASGATTGNNYAAEFNSVDGILISSPTANADRIQIKPNNANTSSVYTSTITIPTLSANRTLTLADGDTTLVAGTMTTSTHVHGNITNSGYIGTTPNLVVVTSTGGIIAAKAAGLAGQFLAYNGNWETPPDVSQTYDIIIDSDAKLMEWINHTGGLLHRVLIRKGTWTATSLGPTAGTLISIIGVDAINVGTKYVKGEVGSSIVYSGSYAGNMYGFNNSGGQTDVILENVSITITNTLSDVIGFNGFHKMTDCTATVSGGVATAFNSNHNMIRCIAKYATCSTFTAFYSCQKLFACSSSGALAPTSYYFRLCYHLSDCYCTGTNQTGITTASGFDACSYLINCNAYIPALSPTGTIYGFRNSLFITNCVAEVLANGTSGNIVAFSGCSNVVNSKAVATVAFGTGYGFSGCRKLTMNTSVTAKTAKYNTSYVEATGGTVLPAAGLDTATGGWNT